MARVDRAYVSEIRQSWHSCSQHALLMHKGGFAALPIAFLSVKKQKGSSLSTRALNMAGVERFELPTRGFGIRCSANWSYTPIFSFKELKLLISGGVDGTRTRDPRRDRPVF